MILRHRHSGLVVRDLYGCLSFYGDLGLNIKNIGFESWDSKRRIQIAKLFDRDGNMALELIEGNWKNHVCFEVDEIPPGPYVHERITDEFHTVFVEDPEGNLIELTKVKGG